MKKHLMAGTALAAATMLAAGGALAADKKMMKLSISVNGYYEAVVGGILDENTAAETSELDTRTDAEIYFNGRATTDNGLKIHAHVQLEGQNNHSQPVGRGSGTLGDPIDEYSISVSGSFGGVRAAAMYTLIGTAKLNDVDPQVWLADVLRRIAGTPRSRLDELLPWNWVPEQRHDLAA